jgi:F-type H+-transporting ATPase subunit a
MEPVQEETQVEAQATPGEGVGSEVVDEESSESMIDKSTGWVKRNPRRTAIWVGLLLLFLASFLPGLRVPPPHVSLSGEHLRPGGFLTNSLFTTFIVDIVIIALALLATARMKEVPGKWQSFVEMALEYIYGMAESIAGRDARKYFPWAATIFIFVLISNWVDVIPGVGSIVVIQDTPVEEHATGYSQQLAMADGKLVLIDPAEAEEGHGKEVPLLRPPSADLNTTFALALITMVMVQVWGVGALGLGYFRKFFQFSGPNLGMKLISSFVGILELISEFSRLIAFGFRLFGNIFAGEIVLFTMAFLIAYLLPVPFYILEVFVGVVQALVFMMLALVFFTMATISHEHEH